MNASVVNSTSPLTYEWQSLGLQTGTYKSIPSQTVLDLIKHLNTINFLLLESSSYLVIVYNPNGSVIIQDLLNTHSKSNLNRSEFLVCNII